VITSIEKFKLPTKSVDNSVDCGEFAVLSVGFYYRFVKLPKLESIQLVIYKSMAYGFWQSNSICFDKKILLAIWQTVFCE
jgi:hypothetical protein